MSRHEQPGMLLFFSTLFLVLMGCSGDKYTQLEEFPCPSRDVFVGGPEGGPFIESVSSFMERRCGTLDCHGAPERPMRFYGQLSRRHPTETNIVGGTPTTPVELESNYAAVCSVEPEKMAVVTEDLGSSAEKLLLVGKARGLVAHKGGKVVQENSDADRCIFLWLQNDSLANVAAACQNAIDSLQ